MCIRVSKMGVVGGALAGLLLVSLPQTGLAQVLERACYIPEVGAVYRIGEPGLPADCVETTHMEFSWPAVEHDHTVSNLQGYTVADDAPGNGDALIWSSIRQEWGPGSSWRPVNARFYRTEGKHIILSRYEWRTLSASCESSDLLVSGGYYVNWSSVEVQASYPGPSGKYWYVLVHNEDDEEAGNEVWAYAWCWDTIP